MQQSKFHNSTPSLTNFLTTDLAKITKPLHTITHTSFTQPNNPNLESKRNFLLSRISNTPIWLCLGSMLDSTSVLPNVRQLIVLWKRRDTNRLKGQLWLLLRTLQVTIWTSAIRCTQHHARLSHQLEYAHKKGILLST